MAIQATADHLTAKVLGTKTSENYIVKKINFLCTNRLIVLIVFLNASRHSEFTRVGIFYEKSNIDKNVIQ